MCSLTREGFTVSWNKNCCYSHLSVMIKIWCNNQFRLISSDLSKCSRETHKHITDTPDDWYFLFLPRDQIIISLARYISDANIIDSFHVHDLHIHTVYAVLISIYKKKFIQTKNTGEKTETISLSREKDCVCVSDRHPTFASIEG